MQSLWVHLDLMVITAGGIQAFHNKQEARELASIMETHLTRYTQGKGGTASADLDSPLLQVSVITPEDALQGYTEFWFQMYDEEGSLWGN